MSDSDSAPDSATETPLVVAAVEQGDGAPCARCRNPLCGHEVVLSWVLGFKQAPQCAGCLALGLGKTAAELIAGVKRHIDHRDCWSAGWKHASGREAQRGSRCEVAAIGVDATPAPPPATSRLAATTGAVTSPARSPAPEPIADRWDAGDLGCGDLVLELRTRLRALPAGALFEVIALDPGAPADLPAWCGLTGHVLVTASHPRYLIRRRKE